MRAVLGHLIWKLQVNFRSRVDFLIKRDKKGKLQIRFLFRAEAKIRINSFSIISHQKKAGRHDFGFRRELEGQQWEEEEEVG